MSSIESLNANQIASLSSLIAIAIAEDRTADENNILGNLIVAIGSIVLTIAAQQAAKLPQTGNNI